MLPRRALALTSRRIPALYSRWFLEDEKTQAEFSAKLKGNIDNDFAWIEKRLAAQAGSSSGDIFLCGDALSIADVQVRLRACC